MFNFSIMTKYFNKYKKNYSLQKDNAYEKISKSQKFNLDTDNKQLFNEKFNEYVNNFISRIQTNPNIDLKLFYENLKTLKIKEKNNFNKFFFIKTSTHGYYQAYENEISILNEDNFYSIYHEFLHCASRKYSNNKLMVGFHKFTLDEKTCKVKANIGRGLTEGYTALLESRYFDSINHTYKTGYKIEKYIASFLEIIVEKNEMEQLYFGANLDGLIKYLEQFATKDNIYMFLTCLDEICKEKNIKPEKAKRIYKYIAYFLLKTYTCKLIVLLKNKIITREEFENNFDNFVKELSIYAVFDKKNTYRFLTPELTNQLLDEITDALNDFNSNQKIKSK